MWKSYINTPSILPGSEEKQTTQFALQATLPNYDIISLIKFFFECLSKHPQVYRKGISVFSHSGHRLCLVFAFVLIHYSSSHSLCESLKYKIKIQNVTK